MDRKVPSLPFPFLFVARIYLFCCWSINIPAQQAMLITGNGWIEIRNLRHAIWTHVLSRSHFPEKIFFAGENELMLYGSVKYVLKAKPEEEVEVPWAGRVVFEDESAGKMRFYQVYLVCLFLFSFCWLWVWDEQADWVGSLGAVGEE